MVLPENTVQMSLSNVHSAIVPRLSMVAVVNPSVTIMHATGMALTVLWVFHHGINVRQANVGKSLRIRNVIQNATMSIAFSTIMIATETPQLSACMNINAENSTTTVSVMIYVIAKHVVMII